jgi:DNA polymerase-1
VIDGGLHLVETLDDALNMRAWLGERRDWLGFDIETEGLNKGRDAIRLFQVGDPNMGWAVPYDSWRGFIHETMAQYDRRMVAHNLLFDSSFLKRDGAELKEWLLHDSMIMVALYNPMVGIGLKPTAKRVFGAWATSGQEALKAAMTKQGWTWATVPVNLPAFWAYGALDASLTSLLAEKYWPLIQHSRHIYDIEIAAIHVMRDAELRGMKIDLDYVDAQTEYSYQVMDYWRPFIPAEIENPGSDAQVIKYLERMGAVLWKLTDKGNPSCDDDVLKENEQRGIPGCEAIRNWRRARWLENSYWKNMRELNVNGVLRPSIKPVGARTGRMSIMQPALQTIPRGPEVRDAFIAREGCSLLSTDYDQLELRVLADAANEEAMLQAIREGKDMHNFVATSLYGETFTKEQRQICKNGQFAIVYGAGIPQFARTAGIPIEEAEHFMNMYAYMFPGVARFMETMIHKARAEGYVETKFGRRVPVEKDKAYVAVNYYCQPTATADLIKLKIHELSCAGLGDFLLIPIHDEVILEVPDEHRDEIKHAVDTVMTEEQLFSCPLTASGDLYKRWGDKYR